MDRVLLDAFRRGEREALERVYSLHASNVEDRVRSILAGVGRLTPANLADLSQDVFLRAFSARVRAQYDGHRAYRPFLLTIARSVVIDWVRRADREIPVPDPLSYFTDNQVAKGEPASFDSSLLALTKVYVDGLPSDLQAIHRCRFVLAMPQRQSALALGISRQSLRTLEMKLLREFRRYLQGAGAAE
jgi:RNA polymerase sigma factor (sigma-70 family)